MFPGVKIRLPLWLFLYNIQNLHVRSYPTIYRRTHEINFFTHFSGRINLFLKIFGIFAPDSWSLLLRKARRTCPPPPLTGVLRCNPRRAEGRFTNHRQRALGGTGVAIYRKAFARALFLTAWNFATFRCCHEHCNGRCSWGVLYTSLYSSFSYTYYI